MSAITERSADGTVPEHQRRIDEMVAQVLSELPLVPARLAEPPPPRPASSVCPLDRRIADEIEEIRHILDRLGNELAGDAAVLQRHAERLQSLDLIDQLLGHLARIVAAGDKTLAVEQVSLQDLRARLQREPSGRSNGLDQSE